MPELQPWKSVHSCPDGDRGLCAPAQLHQGACLPARCGKVQSLCKCCCLFLLVLPRTDRLVNSLRSISTKGSSVELSLLFCSKLIYLFLVAIGLYCYIQAFSCCSGWGLLSSCAVQASHCAGLSCHRAQVTGHAVFSRCDAQA